MNQKKRRNERQIGSGKKEGQGILRLDTRKSSRPDTCQSSDKPTIRVLNLYAGIGGNRKLWENVEVTAVENNSEIAMIYKHFFPQDHVIVGDAHKYLLKNVREFDFIWSSPPCPTHSRLYRVAVDTPQKSFPIKYPDMRLYQEIILLKHFCKSPWIVENVNGYYQPLIPPKVISRHYFWSNFNLHIQKFNSPSVAHGKHGYLCKAYGFDLDQFKFKQSRKDQVIRSCVVPELGNHLFDCAFKSIQKGVKDYTDIKECDICGKSVKGQDDFCGAECLDEAKRSGWIA